MAVNEQGHKGQYSGNSRHSYNHAHTKVTRNNYGATVKDDLAHMHYLKMDIMYDDHHGHSDEKMTADEKHISKLAGDLKYDKEHHGPGKEKPKQKHEGGEFDPNVKVEGEVVVTGKRKTGGSGEIVSTPTGKYRKVGGNLYPYKGPSKALVGDQHKLPDHLKKAILAAPGKYEGAAKISPERLEKIAGQLRQASAMHKGQAQKIDNMLKSTK